MRTDSVHKRLSRERMEGLTNKDEIAKEKELINSLGVINAGELDAKELESSIAKKKDKLELAKKQLSGLEGDKLASKEHEISQLEDAIESEGKDLVDAREQAKALRGRFELLKSNSKYLQSKISADEFKPEVKPVEVKLTKEEQAVEDKLIKVQNDRMLQLMKDKHIKTGWTRLADLANIFRGGMSTGDLSGLGRQGAMVVSGYPLIAARASKFMMESAVSQRLYDRWFYGVRTKDPRYKDMVSVKLGLTDMNDPDLNVHEEAFQTSVLEKIPLYKNLYKGSERAYSGVLNKMRVDLYNYFADRLEEQGKTVENSREQYEFLASYINSITGRGNLAPGMMQKVAPLLNAMFFSPRLIAARLNTLSYWARPTFWNNAPKEIKVAYFADLAKFAGVGMTIMALASLYAAYQDDDDKDKVSVDWLTPTNSDFGKIKIKNTRTDQWAGMQQYLVFAARMAAGYSTSQKGVQMKFGEGYKADTRWDLITRMARGKANPVLGMTMDLIGGEDFLGNKIKFEMGIGRPAKYKEMPIDKYLLQHVSPMSIIGTGEAISDLGVPGVGVGVLNLLGWGSQTYDDVPKPTKGKTNNSRSRTERAGRKTERTPR